MDLPREAPIKGFAPDGAAIRRTGPQAAGAQWRQHRRSLRPRGPGAGRRARNALFGGSLTAAALERAVGHATRHDEQPRHHNGDHGSRVVAVAKRRSRHR